MKMGSGRKVYAVLTAVFVLAIIFLGQSWIAQRKELGAVKTQLAAKSTNQKVLNFGELFVKKVLKAQGEISYEERLRLETEVRNLGDGEILDKWRAFVESVSETEAQARVKDLLEALFRKASGK